jgi:hypothetical protein
MHRSLRWRSGRRSISTNTAHATARTPRLPPSTHLIVAPDGGRQLTEGLVLEASVVARLLGVRLLVIDANLIVAPAQVKDRTRAATYATGKALAPVEPPTRTHAIGAGLAAAERYLSEAAASLARSRS